MANFLSNLIGRASGGLLGNPQAGQPNFIGPVQPPVQAQPSMSGLLSNPAFLSAVSSLGGTLAQSGAQGDRFGVGFSQGISQFAPNLMAGQAAQAAAERQSAMDELSKLLTMSQIQKNMSPDRTTAEKNALAIGLQPGTAEYNNFIREAVLKPSTTVNVGAGETEFSKERGKQKAQRIQAFEQQADSALQSNASLSRIQSLLDKGELNTGSLADARIAIGRFANTFGVDPEVLGVNNLNNLEEFSALSSSLTLNAAEQLKGALSDRDLNFLNNTVPSIAATPQGNKQRVAFMKKLNDRKVQVAKMAKAWVRENGDLDAFNDNGQTFEESLQAYGRKNELFGGEKVAAPTTGNIEFLGFE